MSRLVLLTGATGFVGRSVLAALGRAGVSVRVVVRRGSEHRLSDRTTVESVVPTEDVFSETVGWWTEASAGADTVIHAAWYVEPGKCLTSEKNLDCLEGTLRLARGVVRAGIKRFIGVGTCFEYDLSGGVLAVDTPLRPTTPYGGAKAAAFTVLSQWLPERSVDFAWCRLFHLYGEGEDARRLVPYVRARLAAGLPAELTSGNQVRDFLDFAEAAEQIVEIALGDSKGPVNICSGKAVTVRQLAEAIADEYGRRDLLNLAHVPMISLIRLVCLAYRRECQRERGLASSLRAACAFSRDRLPADAPVV